MSGSEQTEGYTTSEDDYLRTYFKRVLPTTDDGAQVLPLRAFELNSAPFHRRAIAFSGDAELAVAADDSVHIIPPSFPHTGAKDLTEGLIKSQQGHDDVAYSDDEVEDDPAYNTDSEGARMPARDMEDQRRQYLHGARHIPVSAPLHINVNRHLYETAGQLYPYDTVTVQSSEADDDEEGTGEPRIFSKPVGAGSGPINAAGGSLNSVVDIQWSPCGLGRNRRCVLGVLTTSGILTVYGESPERPINVGTASYEYSTWKILWAVGERLIVPPQTAYGECIKSFAWSPELFEGFAMVAAKTSEGEIFIIAVKRVTIPGDGMKIKKEDATWHVREVARFQALGPHPKGSWADPSYVPCGTGYGLRWGPWLAVGSKRVSVVAYVARNFVGFRKITVDALMPVDKLPYIEVDDMDLSGFCTFLSTDSFIEWEGTVHKVGKKLICRGILATPFIVKVFTVDLASSRSIINQHDVKKCETTWPTPEERSQNPIMGAIIHPQDTPDHMVPVTYTAVRMSATGTNPGWYETNRPTTDPDPRWHQDIHEKINISMPEYIFNAGSSSSGIGSEPESDTPGRPFRAEEAHEVPVPEVRLYTARPWGLAISPGGGITAALVSYHPARNFEHSRLSNARTRVIFDFTPLASPEDLEQRAGDETRHTTDGNPVEARVVPERLSTEARVFEWMYGGGGGVQGASTVAAVSRTTDDETRAKMRRLFEGVLQTQACTYCQAGLRVAKHGVVLCNGAKLQHEFDECGASGVAVLEDFVSRTCGVCGKASMNVETLRKLLPAEKATLIPENVIGGACGGCGGKFVN